MSFFPETFNYCIIETHRVVNFTKVLRQINIKRKRNNVNSNVNGTFYYTIKRTPNVNYSRNWIVNRKAFLFSRNYRVIDHAFCVLDLDYLLIILSKCFWHVKLNNMGYLDFVFFVFFCSAPQSSHPKTDLIACEHTKTHLWISIA